MYPHPRPKTWQHCKTLVSLMCIQVRDEALEMLISLLSGARSLLLLGEWAQGKRRYYVLYWVFCPKMRVRFAGPVRLFTDLLPFVLPPPGLILARCLNCVVIPRRKIF